MSDSKGELLRGLVSVEAEQSVLGGLMLDNDRWDDIALILSVEDFFSKAHQIYFREMKRLIGAGKPIDLLTLTDFLKQQEQLELVGGFAYAAELSKNTPSAANIVAYSEIVARFSRARQLVTLGSDITREATAPRADIAEIMEKAEKRIIDIAEKSEPEKAVSLIEGMERLITQLELRNQSGNGITGTPTGFVELDASTCGLQNSDLILLAGRPSMGKTALAMSMVVGALQGREGSVVQVYSLEQPTEQLLMRMISSLGRIELQRLKSGLLDDEDWARISHASSIMVGEWRDRLIIDDTGSLTPAMLRIRARRNARKNGPPALIMLDYLQLMRCPRQENRTQEIAEISRSLKALAKEMKCPVLALSQLNRSLEQRADKRPNNGDLRDSGALEQDADVIMFVYRDEVYNVSTEDQGIAEIIIGKQRQGPIGTVRVRFDSRYTRFDDIKSWGPADE
ncbi:MULTISPECIES: SPI-7-type island replicative DNA helicase [Yersinia pseudotuberculosis complex]|uniref:Replicative DNA helicase n=1 Tax=Yersinia pseudotuberculosis serotype O:1b (strain IP 31758) TaxID=349747 RepID=A0A0U1QYL5_YERP3|nr:MULTISPECIES: SPI-7-type island replicative DNA helicase [Yersinia pseudotuberculosis complex]ABS47819.1 replicative DNA helicase [Yersinia pseudotuberculosis IP 31758]MCE4113991.1 SPI-7-type island replicative DNA helicase [Yersinia pseudotuberculosis]MCF1164236.1 SPI-7-type island replicative DNA helicase [Yersinia pseudotuberculosis]RYC23638.1 replicative DNA helicase [Yersinia pseudotuberculosis]UFA63443.1 Replicative DNA helicase DnaB [Yersinia pseudotuberculosis]